MPPQDESPLGPYLETPVKLFVADPVLLKHTVTALASLGFRNLSIVKAKTSHFEAMRQLFGEVKGFDGLVLVNHPPQRKKDESGRGYDDYAWGEFYKGVASFHKSDSKETSEVLGSCVPIFASAQDQDIRLSIIEQLFPYGITGVFMLSQLGYGISKEEQQEERTHEIAGYLGEYFSQRNQKLSELKEYKSAAELKERRAKAEELMAMVEKFKEAGDLEKAVAYCRQATEALPSDPEAYLEGGRLLVKQKKYPPAMHMFRDAEKVAEALPTPNQEIGNMRVIQVKEHLHMCRETGRQPDTEMVGRFLEEAVESFGQAMDKASKIVAANREVQREKREAAIAQVTDNILTLGLAEVIGANNKHVRALGGLVSGILQKRLNAGGELSPTMLIQMGLMAFYEGDYDKAEKTLFQAAQDPDASYEAQVKINYMATQLRQGGQVNRAIRVYERLLQLGPSEKGVVLFNLGAAQQTLVRNMMEKGQKPKPSLQLEAICNSVEAIYLDPSLPDNPNFYLNTVLAPGLMRAYKTFSACVAAAKDCPGGACEDPGDQAQSPTDRACRQATQKLEALLASQEQSKALDLMFSMASSLRPYFLEFDKHASDQVAQFAKLLHPKLLKHPKPKMQIFGKVLGVLVDKAQKAVHGDRPRFKNQALNKVYEALEMGDQPLAAHELTLCLISDPTILQDSEFVTQVDLMNLSREVHQKMSRVKFKRFKAKPA